VYSLDVCRNTTVTDKLFIGRSHKTRLFKSLKKCVACAFNNSVLMLSYIFQQHVSVRSKKRVKYGTIYICICFITFLIYLFFSVVSYIC
jgi:hypothetical protein